MFDDVWRRKSLCEHDAKCNNFHITYTAYWATKNVQTLLKTIFTVERRRHCVDMDILRIGKSKRQWKKFKNSNLRMCHEKI